METITNTLRDSKVARWSALAVVAFTMLCGYYLTDVMAPLKPLLEKELLWNSADYGFFTSAYGWFNVFLLMLIFGGIILDKMGVRFTGKMATIIMVIGTAIKYWAISTHALDGHTILGWKAQVMVAGLGFATFGVGVEVAGITVSKIIVKWFKGKELALAMGLEMATARLGTTLAMATSIPIARAFNGVSKPILVCLIMLCIGMIAFFFYATMDKKLDKSLADEALRTGAVDEEESFKVSHILLILKNKGWWYIAILCVLFYSAVFPFIKFATDLMVNKFHVGEKIAGDIPALLPFGTILLTPLFGNIYDRKGKGATIMIIGALLLILVHAVYSVPFLTATPLAVIMIIILGIALSLVPSAMWPSVPKIIPEKQLGTAYGMIFLIQNIGLSLVPLLIGWVLNKYCISGTRMLDGVAVSSYNYTIPMIIFTCFGILALIFALLLKAEDKKKGYGLELPNIKQHE
jgi:nitrate/nitrite transporter NarK